jgi:hypothetical protein
MVTGVLRASGLNFGTDGELYMKPRPNQPRGFLEHKAVRQKVVKPKLRQLNADPKGQRPLPPRDLNPPAQEVNVFGRKVRKKLNGAEAYKDAKCLLLWPYFHLAFPNALWILVRRERKNIARSCQRAKFMDGYTYFAGWLHWVDEHLERMADLKKAGARVVEIWPDPMEPETFRDIIEAADLTFDAEAVRAALVPEAWHG